MTFSNDKPIYLQMVDRLCDETPTTRDRLKAIMSAIGIEGYCHIYKGAMRWVIDEGKQANGWTVRVM